MRWRRGLIGFVGDMIAMSEENAEQERRRENMMLATAALTTGYGQGYGDPVNVGPQSMNLADAVQESIRYALELTERLEASCDREVLRVLKMMPKWNPGKHDGKPVKVEYSLPFSIHLQ